MALTANTSLDARGFAEYGQWVVLSGATIYKGAMVGLVFGTGTVTNYNDATKQIFVGYAREKVVGDGTLKIRVGVRGDILNSVTVTGTTAATDNGKTVYATDENTFTLTRPSTNAGAVGIVAFWRTSTTVDLLLLSAQSSATLALAGGNKQRVYIGSIGTTGLEPVLAVNLFTSMPLWGHGKIVDFYAYADGFDASYTEGSQTLNLEIDGTNLTGGTLVLAYTQIDATGDQPLKKTSAAITGANEFSDGALLDVEMATGGTAFTAGVDTVKLHLYMDVEWLAGQ